MKFCCFAKCERVIFNLAPLYFRWYHHFRSAPGRSLAINFWFSHLLWFNKTDCDTQGDKAPFIPLKDFKLASPNEQLR